MIDLEEEKNVANKNHYDSGNFDVHTKKCYPVHTGLSLKPNVVIFSNVTWIKLKVDLPNPIYKDVNATDSTPVMKKVEN